MFVSLKNYKKVAIEALKKKYNGLTCRHRIHLIEDDCEHILEVNEMMASWFPPTWDLSYLKGQALLYFALAWCQDSISTKEFEKGRRMLKSRKTKTSWDVFEMMSQYPGWDFTFNKLKEKAEEDLETYIDEFEEVAVESPVWIIELQEGCKTSMDIINYMQEFGWSGKCICREAKYLSSQCAYCKEQMSHLYEEIFSLDGLCGEI